MDLSTHTRKPYSEGERFGTMVLASALRAGLAKVSGGWGRAGNARKHRQKAGQTKKETPRVGASVAFRAHVPFWSELCSASFPALAKPTICAASPHHEKGQEHSRSAGWGRADARDFPPAFCGLECSASTDVRSRSVFRFSHTTDNTFFLFFYSVLQREREACLRDAWGRTAPPVAFL